MPSDITRAGRAAPARADTNADTMTGAADLAAARDLPGADPRRWAALPVLLAGAFLTPLDFFIVNVALPAIRQGLGTTPAELQLIIAGYAATYAVFLITGGRLGDLFGRKRMFMTGMGGFTLASLICGIAPSGTVLIVGRMLQGLAAAVMVPQVLASIRTIFPAAEQARALGYFGSIFGLAAIAGQICGGLLIALHPLGLGWQSIFLVNIPIGCVALIAAAVLLRENRSANPSRPDLPGILLLSLTLILLVIPLVEGPDNGWPAWTILGLAAVVPLLVLFLVAEARLMRRGAAPLVDLRLFRNPGFSVGLLMTLLFNGGATFFLTYAIYLQNGLGWGALPAGLAILPFAIGFFVTPLMSSGLMGRLGSGILNLGFGMLAAGFGAVAAVLFAHGGPWGIPGVVMYAGLFVAGVGQGFVLPSLVRTVLQAVRPQDAGLASGVLNTTLQISTALSTAIIGGVFFAVIGPAPSQATHTLAFAVALSCIVVLELLSFMLALLLVRLTSRTRRRTAAL